MGHDGVTTERYAKDPAPDRWDNVLFEHAFLALDVAIAMLCLLLGWRVGLLAAVVHAASYLALNAAISTIGHSFGSKSHPNTAFKNQGLAFVTGGESLYNSHHSAPTFAQLAHCRHESDPARWVIPLMVRARVATLRLTEAHFVSRSPPSTFG
jgi:fatty-acid desaturase